MIKGRIKSYCNEDISLIENYELAVNDKTQIWDCHHRNEITDDGAVHSVKWLIDNDLYYHRPACELIFLTKSEHSILHATGENHPMYGKHHSFETKKKMSEAKKGKHYSEKAKQNMSLAKSGENHPMYGKHHSEETKKKISESNKGKQSGENHPMFNSNRKWMTNGIVTLRVKQNEINTYISNGYKFGRKL